MIAISQPATKDEANTEREKWADYFTSLQRAQGAGAPQQASSTVESVRVVPSGGAPSEKEIFQKFAVYRFR